MRDAAIEVWISNAFEGILPAPVHTDNNGIYMLTYPPWGPGFISASKLAEGYPDPTIALYDQRHASSMKQIDLKRGAHLKEINLQFEDPLPSIVFQTENSGSQKPPVDARFKIQWIDNPEIVISQNVPENGTTVISLPRHPVEVTIAAPGYKDWHWHGDLSREPARSKPTSSEQSLLP